MLYLVFSRKIPPIIYVLHLRYSFYATSSMQQDELKRAVSEAAINLIVPKLTPSTVLGIGTGSTANVFIDLLSEHKGKFKGAVSSSEASSSRLQRSGISVYELTDCGEFDVYIDGADESDANLALIKGGGGALTREKIIAACAKTFICIADESKWVKTLGQFPLPVEVIPMAFTYVAKEIKCLGGTPRLREGFVTDNGNLILDVTGFKITQPKELETTLNQITGVVTNGLFALRPADTLLLGTQSGVKTYSR